MRWSWIAGIFVLTLVLGTTFLTATETSENKPEPDLPTTGKTEEQFVAFDHLMTSFVKQHGWPGAALAVAKNGQVVYTRGFGYADSEKKEPVAPNALFRIASLSKPITAAAVLQLVERNKLKLDDRVFDVLQLKEPNDPQVQFDDRWKRVTILQLLQHTGGWNREQSFDPMFRSTDIMKELNVAAPVGTDAIIRYMLRRPLNFDPGTQYSYSNFGYCLLGRVIEKVSGQKYESYVCREVLAPLGIDSMKIGKTLAADRARGEVKYYTTEEDKAVLGPQFGEVVPQSYGAWNHEALDAHGGWIASADDLVRFAAALNQPANCKILSEKSIREMFARPQGVQDRASGKPKNHYYGCGWCVRPVGDSGKLNTWHNGSLPGTSSLLVRRSDGLTWAVLFNSRDGEHGAKPADTIDVLLHDAADAYLKTSK
jgi:CubicO group peptidase (beta-lactamase class C family)